LDVDDDDNDNDDDDDDDIHLSGSSDERSPVPMCGDVGGVSGSNLELLEELGRGSHGVVHKARFPNTLEFLNLKMVMTSRGILTL